MRRFLGVRWRFRFVLRSMRLGVRPSRRLCVQMGEAWRRMMVNESSYIIILISKNSSFGRTARKRLLSCMRSVTKQLTLGLALSTIKTIFYDIQTCSYRAYVRYKSIQVMTKRQDQEVSESPHLRPDKQRTSIDYPTVPLLVL